MEMSARSEDMLPENVDRLPVETRSTLVSDELGRLREMLRGALPPEAAISFLFDGRLSVRIDVRRVEQVMAVEGVLPTLGGGIFRDVRRGQAPNPSFMHRVIAWVDR